MILGIDHVGVATADAAGVGDRLALLGLRHLDGGAAADYGVACDFWGRDAGTLAVEVVSPLRPGSAVEGRLGREGPGLYHLAFEVTGLDAERERLHDAGFLPLDVEPCSGARPGMRVQFLLDLPTNLCIELVEYTAGRAAPR